MKHTPAPWKANRELADVVVITGLEPKYATKYHNGKITIARVYEEEDDETNTNLILAAPDLLAALEGLFKECAMIHKYGGSADNTQAADEAIKAARAAIAKAKGE